MKTLKPMYVKRTGKYYGIDVEVDVKDEEVLTKAEFDNAVKAGIFKGRGKAKAEDTKAEEEKAK